MLSSWVWAILLYVIMYLDKCGGFKAQKERAICPTNSPLLLQKGSDWVLKLKLFSGREERGRQRTILRVETCVRCIPV